MPNTAVQGLQAVTAMQDRVRTPSSAMDKDAFLRLLSAQLRHQDPTNAQDLSQQMAQVAQMAIVEQLTNLNSRAEAQARDLAGLHAEALIGHTVTYGDPSATGTVEKVTWTSEGPRLTVSGVAGVDPATVTEVS